MIRAGAAVVDVTPGPGLAMSGFVARTEPAIGAHDPLTVRAVAVDDTALIVCDVLGVNEEMSARIRARCALPADNVIIAALHTHGAPASMPGRGGNDASPAFLQRLEDACVTAVADAQNRARPCRLLMGSGRDPGIARNRRHEGGAVDDRLPVVKIVAEDGKVVAVLVSYACHPVVLGADNLLYTADFPHYVRLGLEENNPGSVAVFMTGAAADANTGHSAHASVSLAANPRRSFAEAERVGRHIADCASGARLRDAGDGISVRNEQVSLRFSRRETHPPEVLAARWKEDLKSVGPAQAALLAQWVLWAETIAPKAPEPWTARVSVLDWGAVRLTALPGEIFAETAHAIRALSDPRDPSFVLGYADGNPGYIAPESEFAHGGYEIDEAHRYYGFPATFAPDSVPRLLSAVERLTARKQRSHPPDLDG